MLRNPPPARPTHLGVQFERTAERVRFSDRRPRSAFLILSLVGWVIGGGGALATAFMQLGGSISMLIGTIVAALGWLAMLVCFVRSLTLAQAFSLDIDGATCSADSLGWHDTTNTLLREIAGFRIYKELRDVESDAMEWGIEMQTTDGEPRRFPYELPRSELLWLCFQLNDHLTELRARAPGLASAAIVREDGAQAELVRTLAPSDVPATPADSRWMRRNESDAIVFVQRGRFAPVTVVGMLLINALLIGIVGMFVVLICIMFDEGHSRVAFWAIIGLLFPGTALVFGMLWTLMLVLVDGFRTTEWRVAANSMHFRRAWFGHGNGRDFPIDRLDRLEQRCRQSSPTGQWADVSANVHFDVALVDETNTDVCVLADLTNAEVQWMADVLYRERGEWFGEG